MSVFKDVTPEDPMEIVGVVLDRPVDRRGLDEMARTFVEEYALMGWPAKRILGLFRHPFYGGAHDAYEALGEARILALIEATLGPPEDHDA